MPRLSDNIQLLGDKNLARVIGELKDGMQRRIMTPAIRAALMPVKQAAKSNAPHRELRRLIKTRTGRSRSGGIFGKVFVGAHPSRTIKWGGPNARGKNGEVNFAVVGAFYEFGTPNMSPTFWMRGTMRSNRSTAMSIMKIKARERLNAEIKRARRSGTDIYR